MICGIGTDIAKVSRFEKWIKTPDMINKFFNEKEIKTNENENTISQNLWNTGKAVLRRRFIVIQPFLSKQEKSQINKLIYLLKELEKRKN